MQLRHAARRAATLLALAVVMGGFASVADEVPASASEGTEPGRVLVSVDGDTWSTGPLIGPDLGDEQLVPGASTRWSFHVRNDSPSRATLRVSVRFAGASSSVLVDHLHVTAETRDGGASASSPVHTDACLPVLTTRSLAPGEDVEVELVVTLDPDAPNGVQGASASPTVFATLTEEVARGGADPCSDDRAAPLAHTGGSRPTVLPGLLAVVAGAGMVGLVAAHRRTRSRRR